MGSPPIEMRDTIRINCLYSFYYSQFATGYIFPGEAHDFWEMVYIDQGEADIGAGDGMYRMRQGQVIFHQPNEWHSIRANSADSPNIFVVTFDAEGEAMERFRGRHFTLTREQRSTLSRLIAEGRTLFGPVLESFADTRKRQDPDVPVGTEQMVVLYLEMFLIQLLRDQWQPHALKRVGPVTVTEDRRSLEAVEQLTELFRERLDGSLRFPEVCRRLGIGETALKECARKHLGMGAMEYYQHLRLDEARRLLREGRLNITQIAGQLGYTSPQSFTRQFRRMMGMTPSQYLRMILE
jgi:AraC-like DNA-binding protein